MQLSTLLQGRMWKFLLVNALSCGLEACMSTVTVYIPPLLLQAGMERRYMTMVLAMAPVMGMIFIPMIGSASDSHQSRFGRRRPFIWMLSLGILLGLQIMPQARRLALLMSPQHHHWLEAAMQAAVVSLLNFCGQACLTLLVALLSDLFPEQEENSRAFSVYSMMISLGGCLGFLLPAVDWRDIPIAVYLGGQEGFIYALLTIIFLSCLLTTAFIPEEVGTRAEGRAAVVHKRVKSESSRFCPRPQDVWVTLSQRASAFVSVLPRVYAACVQVPTVIWRLFVADLCNWMALMSVIFFFADFMGEGLYQGVASAEPESEERKQFDEGVRMGSLSLFLQFVVSVLCSTLMDRLVARLGPRVVFFSSGALLVVATAVMTFSGSVVTVAVMAALTGYTLCVLHVLPYTLLCQYQSNKQVYFTTSRSSRCCLLRHSNNAGVHTARSEVCTEDETLSAEDFSDGASHVSLLVGGNERGGADCTPEYQRGVCYNMAILESAYLISEVLPAMCLGSVVQLANSVRAYMASACCFSVLAFLFSTRIVYSHTDLDH